MTSTTSMMHNESTELVPGISVGEVCAVLNNSESGFKCHLDPSIWTKAPELKILGEGKGFCSCIYSVRFYPPEGEKTVVLKVPRARLSDSKVSNAEELNSGLADIHRNELTIYRLFKQCGYGDLKLLQFYGGREWTEQELGFILLEDVSDGVCNKEFTGWATYDDFQVREAITEIAKMQAIGFRFPKDETKQLGLGKTMLENMFRMLDNFYEQVEQKKYDFMTPERLTELKKVNGMDEFLRISRAHRQSNLPDVLVHDDFWIANILQSPDGHLMRILDWQSGSFSNFAQDIALLLALVIPGAKRRVREDEYLRFYMDQMKLQLSRFGISDAGGMESLTLDVVRKAYRESLKWALVNVIFTLLCMPSEGSLEAGNEDILTERFRCCIEDLWP